MDGQPLAGASITFVPVLEGEGLTAGGISREDGSYHISSLYGEAGRGALAGDYVVILAKTKEIPLAKPIKYDDGTVSTTMSESVIPAVYRDKTKSPLKVTVKRGKNTFDLELSSKP